MSVLDRPKRSSPEIPASCHFLSRSVAFPCLFKGLTLYFVRLSDKKPSYFHNFRISPEVTFPGDTSATLNMLLPLIYNSEELSSDTSFTFAFPAISSFF